MSKQVDLDQLDLLFSVNKLAYKRLLTIYNKSVFIENDPMRGVLELLDLVVNEIDRLTIDE